MDAITCERIHPTLGLVDAELSADEQDRIAGHLATCADCRAQAEALWRQDRALAELAAETTLADALAARIGERLRAAAREPAIAAAPEPMVELARSRPIPNKPAEIKPPANSPIAWRAWSIWGVAAAVLVALGVWALRGPVNVEPRSGGQIAEFAQVEAAVGRVLLVGAEGETAVERGQAVRSGAVLQTVGEESLAVVKLADGTRLELGADTKVTLDDDGPNRVGKRIVLNEGFLTADVAKQPAGRPMTLSTPQAELVVLGTKFQLSGGAELTYVETAEGSVRVTRKSDGRTVVVDGGFEAAVGEGSELAARSSPPASLEARLKLDGFFASALSHDGRTLAASRYLGGEIQWWDVEAEKLIHSQSAQRRRVHAMAFSPDDRTLATGGVDGLVKLWDRSGTEPKQTFPADGPWISDVAGVGEFWGVLSGAEGLEERTLSLRTSDGRSTRSPLLFTAQRWAFSADGSRLATYDRRTKTVSVHDTLVNSVRTFATPVGNNVFSMAFSHNGRFLSVDGSSGMIVLCDAYTGHVVRRIERRGGRIFGMAFSHDDRLLATGHQDGTVRVWNLADGTQWAVSAGGPVHNRAVAFTPDGRKLMTREIRLAGDGTPRDGVVRIWEVPEEGAGQ